MAKGRACVFAATMALLAAPAGAEQPLSAIDWLSDTVSEPVAPPAPATPVEEATSGSPIEAITTRPIDGPNRDATGILSARVTGLPADFWAASSNADLIEALAKAQFDHIPALRDFMQVLLLSELDPPHDSDASGAFLVARIDKLLDMAALDAAGAMIDLAGPMTPELFRRAFDVALLLGTEDDACVRLRESPGIAPTLNARIFCLARGGDWQAAQLTFNTAQALGQLSPEDEALIERFLDPDLFEDEDPLPPPEKLTPLNLRLYEAIGEALPGASLPLAFAHSELSAATGWKARIEAGERLARVGAITPGQMFALYTERMPAASGGVWTRVDAVQRFETAITAGDPVGVARSISRAWDAMHAVELEVVFAEHYSEQIMRLPLPPEAADTALKIALLSRKYETAARSFDQADNSHAFLRGLALGKAGAVPLSDRMARAIAPVFAESAAPPAPSQRIEALMSRGALGEAVLFAMSRIEDGVTSDPRAVTEGLALLRRVGLEDLARRAALQLMILERRG